MKYKIIKSDLLLKGKIIPENSEIDLTEADIKGIEDYLRYLPPDTLIKPSHSEPALSADKTDLSSEESHTHSNTQKTKTKRGNK